MACLALGLGASKEGGNRGRAPLVASLCPRYTALEFKSLPLGRGSVLFDYRNQKVGAEQARRN